MERRRAVAAAPVRSARTAWDVVVKLLADTLERSDHVPTGSVTTELRPLDGVAPALIAGGHLETTPLVLVASDLRLTVEILTGDAALTAEENLNPVPGGAQAPEDWVLYVPRPSALGSALDSAIQSSDHVSSEDPPKKLEKAANAHLDMLDDEAINRIGEVR